MLQDNRPTQYRAKAQAAREKAAAEPGDARRKTFLNDADMWERMADYEDRNPSHDFQAYYPRRA
jgi:hypothetical protein